MSVSRSLRYQILRRDGHKCRYCGAAAPDVKLTIDHVVPEALGGTDGPANLVAACESCNGGKSATPADAAQVADVSRDAERWARAQAIAADRIIGDVAARNERQQAFLARWHNWESRRREDVPLQPGWQRSIDAFVAAGLTHELILDAVDSSMRNSRISPPDRFRYFCGIAWKRVTELRDVTADIIAAGAEGMSEDDSDEANDLAVSVLGALYPAERDAVLHDSRYDDTGRELTNHEHRLAAAEQGISAMSWQMWRLESVLDHLISYLPAEIVEICQESTAEEFTSDAAVDTPPRRTLHLAHLVTIQLAAQYFETLPVDEQAEWRACGQTIHPRGSETDRLMASIDYAHRWHSEGFIPPGMCLGPGNSGARCQSKAAFQIWIEDCTNCEEPSSPGHGACVEHLAQAVGGQLIWDGSPVRIRDSKDFTGDPWSLF